MSKLELIRLYFKEKPILDKLQKEFRMKLSTNVVLQLLALVAQGVNSAEPILSPNGKFWAATGLAAIQVTMAVIGHLSDQQGNPLPPSK